MDSLKDYLPLAGVVVGWALATGAQLWQKRVEFRRADQGEQKKLAFELLVRVERFCGEAESRHDRFPAPNLHRLDDPLEALRGEMAAYAVGLTDPRAREHMEYLDRAMEFQRDPSAARIVKRLPPSPRAIRIAARGVLGAMQRGESLPQAPDDGLLETLHVAQEVRSCISQMIADRQDDERLVAEVLDGVAGR